MALNLRSDKSDRDAKAAYVRKLQKQGYKARVTKTPDITATLNGRVHYFEIKYTRSRKKSYFGAATLTEWSLAFENPRRFWFVVAFKRAGVWTFRPYTPAEFMRFSSIPPFKIFFNVPMGAGKAVAGQRHARSIPLNKRKVPSIRLSKATFNQMIELWDRWRPRHPAPR